MKVNQQGRACLCYGGLCMIAALAAFPCFRFLPAAIERVRFHHGDQPLLLPSDLLLAKHLSELCFYAPFLFAILGLAALFFPAVAQTRVIVVCAFGLAALYSVFIVVLSSSLDTAILIQRIQ